MSASKSANINWVKELYLAQSYDVLNDSVILLKKDQVISDFALNKKEKWMKNRKSRHFENPFEEKLPLLLL